MRAEASHASAMRVVGRTSPIDREVVPLRTTLYVDYGRPPPGKSLSYGVAALVAAWLLLMFVRIGLL